MCTLLTSVSRIVESATGIQLVTQVGTNGGPARAVTLSYAFDRPVDVAARSSDWTCSDGRGGTLGTGRVSQAVCSFQYAGAEPPALTLEVASPSSQQPLSGTVTMQSGSDTSTESFTG